MSTEGFSDEEKLCESVSTSKATGKRRGRKRNSDLIKDMILEKESLFTNEKIESDSEILPRSGRKRKTVNYFELANPDVLDEDFIEVKKKFSSHVDIEKETLKNNYNEPKISGVKTENFGANEKRKGNTKPQINVKAEKATEEIDSTLDGKINRDVANSILASVGLTKEKRLDKDEGKIDLRNDDSSHGSNTKVVQSLIENSIDQDNDFNTHNDNFLDQDNDSNTQKEEKKIKYRKTGNTIQMMNTLFSQSMGTAHVVDTIESSQNDAKPFKRGRPPGRGKKTETIKTEIFDILSDNNTVICAICKAELGKDAWIHHKQRFHNNLAWRVGEPPLDLSNQALVLQILNALYKNKKPLYCDVCNQAKKSVVGFLSHKAVCGRTDVQDAMIACTYCEKKMLPASMPSHIKFVHEKPANKEEAKVNKISQTSLSESKGKRKAATKALKVIQCIKSESSLEESSKFKNYFADLSFISSSIANTMLQKQIIAEKTLKCKYSKCKFESDNIELMKTHLLATCSERPDQGFVCKHCLMVRETVFEIIQHIETIHEVYISEYSASSEEETDQQKSNKNDSKKKPPEKKVPEFLVGVKKHDVIFEKSYLWTLNFCDENFSTILSDDYFKCLKKNWKLVNVDDMESYLPKMGTSLNVSFSTVKGFEKMLPKEHSFQKFDLFQVEEHDGNFTIFCGGPVNALAWMPTPYAYMDCDQILAVAIRDDPDRKYTSDSNYHERGFIQFWNFGSLRNGERVTTPELAFGLSFDHGPIWHMEWCPSSCFETDREERAEDTIKRMGVLGVAGSDSGVYIYSIPFPTLEYQGKFCRTEPILKLMAINNTNTSLNKRKFYPTKISWTKAAGHRYVAVGYTNGMVAMFDLFNSSKLIRRVDDSGIETLYPYKTFQAHFHFISALVLYHLSGGCRWLLTGSCDKSVHLWDLNDVSSPITSHKRQIVTDGIWMSNWICHTVSYDEASTTTGCIGSSVQQVRGFLSDILYLFHSSATVCCLAGSDWLNGVIQGNLVGEIFATFPKQLLCSIGRKSMKNKKLLLGYTTLVEKNKTPQERVKENDEKEKALKNELRTKTRIKENEIPSDKEVTHLDYNPHYYKYEPILYDEADEKYGLVFSDHKMSSYKDFPPNLQEGLNSLSKHFQISKPNMYPLQAINKIEFNPNRQSTTYYASGYQAGFVRLTCLKFLQKDPYVVADMHFLNGNN